MKIGNRTLKPGDLIKYTDYIQEKSVYGLYISPIYKNAPDHQEPLPWADIVVWSAGGEEEWISWQCEVVSEGR